MSADTTMQESNAKRPISGIAVISAIEEYEVRQSKKPAVAMAETVRVGMTEDLVMAETETERKIKRKFRISKPCCKEDVIGVSVTANGEKTFYVSGLKGLKEGLAIAAYHDVQFSWHESDQFTAELNAGRLAEVRGVIELMLDHVDELSNLCKGSDDLRDKLTYMLGATWTGLMCANSQGTGQGTLQCFPCYYMLVAS